MSRRRPRNKRPAHVTARLENMQSAARSCAYNLSMLTRTMAECLAADSSFILDVMERCPEATPVAPLLRQARDMACLHADSWLALAQRFRDYADEDTPEPLRDGPMTIPRDPRHASTPRVVGTS